ncbi:stage 0 sporulation family protein [Faecalicatena contorta]|mgnify:FL=1|uniref:Stage 0 sporulation family protein n=1 Tax=Faecalicatena fissicatena TaxID=290055 RepID=A0ABS2E9Y0_9FIRM|nr:MULTISPECIES: stage 0 sporulation family protein [Clostridia]MBM6685131.1 stage 0 sporulation family protein [Faecalicatena contorta]MBM6710978.1 stage 0 sporulation family protein [Faecalicatena contorta]MBM6738443.1 stage 0 sporulation family protein [Faecalicatena fissicatena]HIX99726.1 stage 0 sporulation family protein [Candidatus Dorea intestinigallinarum]
MTKVIGVRFRRAGKVYFFSPGKLEIHHGDNVIVETARGVEFGNVVTGPREVEEERISQPLKSVIRIANKDDYRREEKNREKEKEAFSICQEKIRKHGLEMKLIDAEYTFDNNKVLFYFTADGRIDFRELVKDLASVFRTRIELRQIGVRDETKIRGGIGICGRELCCHTYLTEFAPVSIKMAKEQNLSLNPSKISGVCGRLMCCLTNEEQNYEELNSRLPAVGDTVTTPEKLKGDVQAVNVLRQLVKVVVTLDNDEKEVREYKAAELRFKPRRKKKDTKISREEMAQLKALEEKNGASKLDDK